jgi:hypothetical protein
MPPSSAIGCCDASVSGWTGRSSLEHGLQNPYKWIFDQMSQGAAPITR